MRRDLTLPGLAVAFAAVLVIGFLVPGWMLNIIMISFSRALAVIGLMVLWRTGLVSFGHALYFGLGAYTAAILNHYAGITGGIVVLLVAAAVAGGLGFLLGFIIRTYRDIFFAMLSLAFSMVLYGILVKTEELGSTDGFSISPPSFLGYNPVGDYETKLAIFVVLVLVGFAAASLVHRYLSSTLGQLTVAIRDNEIRVEYLGYSANQAVHIKYVMSAVLAGLGGAFMALSLGQVDPDSMVNWTVSGELVFVTILSGPGSVAAPFIGSFIFEIIRLYAYEWLPHAWQLIVGVTLLAIIFFLPDGVWSLIARAAKRRAA